MAWCYYCRTHTVNGKCPKCGRLYSLANKNYDYYGKEIKSSSSTSDSSIHYETDSCFWPGFWLGIAINFGAIIIAKRKNEKMLGGAITGMVINSIFIIHIISVIIFIILYMLGYIQ